MDALESFPVLIPVSPHERYLELDARLLEELNVIFSVMVHT